MRLLRHWRAAYFITEKGMEIPLAIFKDDDMDKFEKAVMGLSNPQMTGPRLFNFQRRKVYIQAEMWNRGYVLVVPRGFLAYIGWWITS